MANLTNHQLDEIAGHIGAGNLCFYHLPSGKIYAYSSGLKKGNEELKGMQSHPNDYISFEKMSSRKVFDAMQAFALSLKHETMKESLLGALNKKHPIKTFENELHALPDDITNDWEKFKRRKTRRWVEEQLELYDF